MRHARSSVIALAIALAMAMLTTGALAQTRVALVIGNNAYLKVPPLGNAVNDAGAIAAELGRMGFTVIRAFDVKTGEINEAKQKFIDAVANGGIGVVYFAGHGLQVEGRNYLLPVDYAGTSVAELGRTAISVPALLDDIERVKPRLSVMILDACRDNPFPALSPSTAATRGLSEIARAVPTGALVLYAASSNQTALDGLPNQPTTNGLFTGELLKAMREPGLEIRDLAQKVRFAVMEKAQSVGHLQVPALYDNLSPGAFYFSALRSPPPPSARGALPARIKLIIPFAARGPSDEVVRALAPFLSKALGRPVDVENQIDVQGDEVAARVAGGPKDGSVLTVSPFAASARRLKAGDQRLVPLGILVDTPLSLAVSDKHGARGLPELLAAARAARRPLRMTVPLPGSPAELCGRQLQKKAGGNLITLVPVNGEGPAVAEVVNGNADLTCASTPPLRNMAQQPNAKVREIAEVRSTAVSSAPKTRVGSTASQGYDIVAPNWLGLFGPAGLSAEARQQISAALLRVQEDPQFAQAMARLHALPVSADQTTPDGLVRALRLSISLQD